MKFPYSIKQREELAWSLLRLIEEGFPEFVEGDEGYDTPVMGETLVKAIDDVISAFRKGQT